MILPCPKLPREPIRRRLKNMRRDDSSDQVGAARAACCERFVRIVVGAVLAGVVALVLAAVLLARWAAGERLRLRLAVEEQQLRTIGLACLVYSAQFGGAYPPELPILVLCGLLEREDLRSPAAGSGEGGCDYFYVAGLRDSDPEEWVLAFGDPQRSGDGGRFVLFRDGRVQWRDQQVATADMQNTVSGFASDRGRPPQVLAPR